MGLAACVSEPSARHTEMEVRETQSYTAAVKYTGHAPMDGVAYWAKTSIWRPTLAVANMAVVIPKVR